MGRKRSQDKVKSLPRRVEWGSLLSTPHIVSNLEDMVSGPLKPPCSPHIESDRMVGVPRVLHRHQLKTKRTKFLMYGIY